jgi:hypothetical protein
MVAATAEIFRTIKMRSVMDTPNLFKVPQCLSRPPSFGSSRISPTRVHSGHQGHDRTHDHCAKITLDQQAPSRHVNAGSVVHFASAIYTFVRLELCFFSFDTGAKSIDETTQKF